MKNFIEIIVDELKGEREHNPAMQMTNAQIHDLAADLNEKIAKLSQ